MNQGEWDHGGDTTRAMTLDDVIDLINTGAIADTELKETMTRVSYQKVMREV